jgi:2-haloacid dehalogenase
LRALKAKGHKTAILSNGTPSMLAAAVSAAGLRSELDAILSVDAIRIYKPRPEVYRMVTETFSTRPGDVLFVSSNRWDVMGASAFGFRAAWINRGGMPEEYAEQPPFRVLSDLHQLVSLT